MEVFATGRLAMSESRFFQAWQIYLSYLEEHFADALRAYRARDNISFLPLDSIRVSPENQKDPLPDHLVLFSDILGFSEGVVQGSDSLPDFYGRALVGAHQHPELRVYVLSDSCLVTCQTQYGESLLTFARGFTSSIQQDGILHQTTLGAGTFTERKPEFFISPKNFLGTQVVGTAIVDAANLAKSGAFGCRILVSDSALNELGSGAQELIVRLRNGEHEYMPDRPPQFDLLDGIHYALCLADHDQKSRVHEHYLWSLASRSARLGQI